MVKKKKEEAIKEEEKLKVAKLAQLAAELNLKNELASSSLPTPPPAAPKSSNAPVADGASKEKKGKKSKAKKEDAAPAPSSLAGLDEVEDEDLIFK